MEGKFPETEDDDEDELLVESDTEVVDEPRIVERPQESVPQLSVIVPAYNEEERIEAALRSMHRYLSQRDSSFEIIVVNDGSQDATSAVVERFQQEAPEIRLVSYEKNRGKGYAVRLGMLQAQGKFFLQNDADGATPITELDRLEKAIDDGADIAIGSRALSSSDTNVSALWYRKAMGRVFNGIVNVVAVPGIADTQCGFKLYRREAAHELFRRQHAEGFSFDVEILYLARKRDLRVIEVPVNWENVPGSKINLVSDSLHMLCDVLRFRFRDLAGGYEKVSTTANLS